MSEPEYRLIVRDCQGADSRPPGAEATKDFGHGQFRHLGSMGGCTIQKNVRGAVSWSGPVLRNVRRIFGDHLISPFPIARFSGQQRTDAYNKDWNQHN